MILMVIKTYKDIEFKIITHAIWEQNYSFIHMYPNVRNEHYFQLSENIAQLLLNDYMVIL